MVYRRLCRSGGYGHNGRQGHASIKMQKGGILNVSIFHGGGYGHGGLCN